MGCVWGTDHVKGGPRWLAYPGYPPTHTRIPPWRQTGTQGVTDSAVPPEGAASVGFKTSEIENARKDCGVTGFEKRVWPSVTSPCDPPEAEPYTPVRRRTAAWTDNVAVKCKKQCTTVEMRRQFSPQGEAKPEGQTLKVDMISPSGTVRTAAYTLRQDCVRNVYRPRHTAAVWPLSTWSRTLWTSALGTFAIWPSGHLL